MLIFLPIFPSLPFFSSRLLLSLLHTRMLSPSASASANPIPTRAWRRFQTPHPILKSQNHKTSEPRLAHRTAPARTYVPYQQDRIRSRSRTHGLGFALACPDGNSALATPRARRACVRACAAADCSWGRERRRKASGGWGAVVRAALLTGWVCGWAAGRGLSRGASGTEWDLALVGR